MSLIKRIENNEHKLEKKINNKIKKIEDLEIRFNNHKISKKEFILKKKHEEDAIKKINNQLRSLMGELAKKKRITEEKKEKTNRGAFGI